MAAVGRLRYIYLAFLSKPREHRKLYRTAKQLRVRKIVELGIGSLERSLDLIRVCQRFSPGETISYTALDWFEERSSEREALSLIETHRQVKAVGAEARLMPGGPVQALPAVANSLLGTDLLLISSQASRESIAGGWFFIPRALHQQSVVLQECGKASGDADWSVVEPQEIEQLASSAASARAA